MPTTEDRELRTSCEPAPSDAAQAADPNLSVIAEPGMNREEAIWLGNTGWWRAFPARDVVLAQLRGIVTHGYLCMPFADLHRMTEEVVGGPVWTHEFIRCQAIIDRIEQGRRGAVNPMRSLADAILRRTRTGKWVTQGRTYRTKALALRSRVLVVALPSGEASRG